MTNYLSDLEDRLCKNQPQVLTIDEYLEEVKSNPLVFASPHERMLKAFGTPEIVDTSKNTRDSIIFGNRTIRRYSPCTELYGLEGVIERVVSFFRHAAQGLEERKQILFLHGPVGSGKSSIVELIKNLIQTLPIYFVSLDGEWSPVFDNPLNLFSKSRAEELGVPAERLGGILSPWLVKRLKLFSVPTAGVELKNHLKIIKICPSKERQIAVMKTEPGDENNQDISTLVGKLKLRALGKFDQSDPDAYDFSGALNRANQGVLEFVEANKAPIKTLNPFLTATQEGNYIGTENIGAIPFEGIIIMHTNDTEYEKFRSNPDNEAFVDRIYPIAVGYNLRVDEEVQIYKKLINSSSLKNAPCAPSTLESLAKFAVLSRIDAPPGKGSEMTKLRVYNGEFVKHKDANALTYYAYKEAASDQEGFYGISTRLAFKVLSRTYNYDIEEIAANPVHLLQVVLPEAINSEEIPVESREQYLAYISKYLAADLYKKIEEDITASFVDAYDEFGQNWFDRYLMYVDYRLQENDFKDPETGQIYNSKQLDFELEKLEKPAGISNPKEFRREVLEFALRHRASHNGKNPHWQAYEQIRAVIDHTLVNQMEDLLPLLTSAASKTKDEAKKRNDFLKRMKERGYTERQAKVAVDFYTKKKTSQ